jgi:hypothetical protein
MAPIYDDPDGARLSDERLRAGDADRDHVAERLRKAHAEGRLDADELDGRLERCLRARTFGELQRLTADLQPPGRRGPMELSRMPPHRRRGLRIVLLAIAVVWALGAAAHGHAHAGGLLIALAFVFLVTRLVRAVRT